MHKKKMTTKRSFRIHPFIAFIITIFVVVYLIITLPFLNKIYPNIYVAGVYLGDLEKEKALETLEKVKITEKLILNISDQKKELLVSDFLVKRDDQKTIERVYNYTNTGNLFLDLFTKLKTISKPVNFGYDVLLDELKIKEALIIYSSEFGEKPVYPSAQIKNGQVIINKGKNGIEINLDKSIQDIKENITFNKRGIVDVPLETVNVELNSEELDNYRSKLQKLVGKKVELKLDFDTHSISDNDLALLIKTDGTLDEQKTKTKIAEIARKINRNPQDSVFVVTEGVVTEFSPSIDGITVNEDLLITEIDNAIKKIQSEENLNSLSINIPVVKLSPKIKIEDINNLGIKTLLGKGVSYFKGSIPNRVHNINLAQSKFKGILIPPDKTFSFNEILGDVSAYTGYKAAYVIKDGKTVLGDGGGVCQVSTTLFRAVLSAGLPVVERKPHSYRVGYYEQGFAPGLDATVFYPTTDFKFKNDTPNHILIQPVIDLKNYNLNFEIYGTSDGRTATTTKPVITSSIAPAPDLYVDDPTLPVGTVKQIEHRAYGARVVFDYTVTRNGETINSQKFISNYRPWQAVYLKGVGQ